MKKLISLFLLTAMTFMSGAVAAETEEKENIALGKKVTAEFTWGLPAENAVDGNSGTIWSGLEEGEEFIIDLGEEYAIDTIEIQARQDQPQTFAFSQICGSTDENFNMFDVINEAGETVRATETLSVKIESKKKYRYIKLIFPAYASPAEIRIFEKIIPETNIKAVEVSYPDITDEKLKNVIGLLAGFGVTATGNGETEFSPDREVTRAQFADMLVKTIGIEYIAVDTPFTDIAGLPEENSIKTLYALNAVDEYAAGLFKPNANIDAYKAAEMTVRALGYADYAKATGRATATYQSKIAELKLMENVNKSKAMTRRDAVFMLSNALEAKVMEIKTVGAGRVNYKKGKTLLECRGYYAGEGVVTENYSLSYNHEWNNIPEERVVIEGEVYAVAYSSMMFHVGDKVRYFYCENNDMKLIVFMHTVAKQKEIMIPAAEVTDIVSRSVIRTENGRTKSERFTANARVIYNGRPVAGNKSISEYKPTEGYVRMLDYDNDGIYDTVIIFDYLDYVVKRINKNDKIYFFEADKPSIAINGDKTAVYYRDGKITNPSSIKVGDVLSVGTSTDGKHYEIYISSLKKEGKISGAVQNEEIEIDYLKKYPLSQGFNNSADIKLGSRGMLYINYEGKAVFFDAEAFARYRYGFLTNAKTEGGISDGLNVQIYTQDGTLEIFKINEKAMLDGKRYTSCTSFLNDLEHRLMKEGKYEDCLIKYRANIDLEITEIDTLYNSGEADGLSQIATITDKYVMYGIFEGKYILDGNTTVFYIYDEDLPEDRYEARSVGASFADRNYYSLEIYGNKKDLLETLPVAIVRKQSKTVEVEHDAYAFLVDKVMQGLSSDGFAVPVICGMYMGKYVQIPFADSDDIPDWINYINFGDIIRIETNKTGEIVKSEFVGEYNREAPEDKTLLNMDTMPNRVDYMAPHFMLMGSAYDMNSSLLCIKNGKNIESEEFSIVHINTFANIYVCDTVNKKVRSGQADEIIDYLSDKQNYSYIFCRLNSGYHRDIIIYSR